MANRGVGIARLVVLALGPGLVLAEVAAARVLSASPSRRLLSFADRLIRCAAGVRVHGRERRPHAVLNLRLSLDRPLATPSFRGSAKAGGMLEEPVALPLTQSKDTYD